MIVRSGAPWVLIVGIVAVLMGASLYVVSRTFSATYASSDWVIAIAATFTVSIACMLQIFVRSRIAQSFDPLILLFAYLILLYVGRPLYVLSSGQLGTHQIGYWTDVQGATWAQWLVLSAVLSLSVGLWISPFKGRALNYLVARSPESAVSLKLLALGAAVSLLAAALIAPDILSYSGGWRAALTLRQDLYAGRTYIVYMLGVMNICWFIVLATHLSSKHLSRRVILWLALTWPVAGGLVVMSGSRSELVTRNLLPLAVLLLIRVRTLARRVAVLAVGILVSASFFFAYRSVVRDPQSATEIEETPASISVLNGPVGYILAGDEASAFDYLAAIMRQVPGQLDYRKDQTARAIIFAPVPSVIVHDKPMRGGEYVTLHLRPGLYRRGGNLAISAMGDLYLTGGIAVVVVGAFILGLVGSLISSDRSESIRNTTELRNVQVYIGMYLYSCILPILRSDLTEFAVGVVRTLLLLLLLRLATRYSRKGSNEWRRIEAVKAC